MTGIKLDDRDIAILRVLSEQGRISNAALAERVGLTQTPCWNRLKKMEKAGLIEGYSARINLRKLAPHATVFMAAELGDHTAASFRALPAAVALGVSEGPPRGGNQYVMPRVCRAARGRRKRGQLW